MKKEEITKNAYAVKDRLNAIERDATSLMNEPLCIADQLYALKRILMVIEDSQHCLNEIITGKKR